MLQEALVRDLCDGGWSQFCLQNSGNLHRLCKEILRKLASGNRLRRFPRHGTHAPSCAAEWCQESVAVSGVEPLTGVIAAHATKQTFPAIEVASIERLTSVLFWQKRSPSVTVDRKTVEYLRVLHLILLQANSLMFIDPNLDPSSSNYRDFIQLLKPVAKRAIKPRIEIHRSFCRGDGRGRTFPTETEWKAAFETLGDLMASEGLAADVYFWDDFHERYLIADIVGVIVPAGFDVTGKVNDPSTWGRIGRDDKDKIQRLFDPAARAESLKWRFMIGIAS